MPLNFLATVFVEGRQAIPYYDKLKTWVPAAAGIAGVKWYFGGSRNTWDRDIHGKVAIVTGGTSGLGAVVVKELAQRGAQVILLVRTLQDGWLAEYVDDLRESTGNPLIFAEEADLEDFYSVRKFATKWLDNLPPRRLDMVVCCAGLALPPSKPRQTTSPDGLEPQIQVGYLSHYLLLTLLTPALRSQPPDREVRIILTTCISSVMAELNLDDIGYLRRPYPEWRPYLVMGEAKLSLSLLGYELQRQFDGYVRKDGAPPNVHVAVVDPGMMRSPSFKRFVTLGRVWMLFVYLLAWPLLWLFFKTSIDGAQSLLFAIMSPDVVDKDGVSYVSEARIRSSPPRSEFKDEDKQKQLFERTAKLIEATEKTSAVERNKLKPKTEKTKKAGQGDDGKNQQAAAAAPSSASKNSSKSQSKRKH